MLYEAQGITRFIVICGYTDLRKGISGLAQIIEGNFKLNPFEANTLFLFCGRRGDRIKALNIGLTKMNCLNLPECMVKVHMESI